MVVEEVLRKEAGYVPPNEQQQQSSPGQGNTGTAIDPFLSGEKSDLEFWIQLLQLVVLIMILREVSR